MADRIDTFDLGIPRRVELRDLRAVARLDTVDPRLIEGFKQDKQLFQRRLCVANQRQSKVLRGIELGHVKIDKAYFGMLECGLRRGSKVAVTRADTDYRVSLLGNTIGGEGASSTDCSKVKWVAIVQAALAGHRLSHRDACLINETL